MLSPHQRMKLRDFKFQLIIDYLNADSKLTMIKLETFKFLLFC